MHLYLSTKITNDINKVLFNIKITPHCVCFYTYCNQVIL